MTKRAWLILAIGAAVVGLTDFECEKYEYEIANSPKKYNSAIYSARIFLLFREDMSFLWGFIGYHHEAIVALFTIILAVVTTLLAYYTYKLHGATLDLAEDAHANSLRQDSLERPWLFLERFRVERREGAPIKPDMPNNWYISLFWKNVGRSPAIIDECNFRIVKTSELPIVPDYSANVPLGCNSTAAAGVEFETKQIGPGGAIVATDGKANQLTIYGKISYRELNGKRHSTGYAIDVSPHLPLASANANRAYDYYE